jgi:hypothetical protein
MTFREYDVVRLRAALSSHQLPKGAVGAIVMVYERPTAFEVEFCDPHGVTLAIVTLPAERLERVWTESANEVG